MPLIHPPKTTRSSTKLADLAQKIRAMEQRTEQGGASHDRPPRVVLHTGWPAVDRVLNRDACEWGGEGIHEWFGLAMSWSDHVDQRRTRAWVPPVSVLAHLVWQAVCQAQPNGQRLVMWIGRRCWPHLGALSVVRDPLSENEIGESSTVIRTIKNGERTTENGQRPQQVDQTLLQQSIFVDSPDAASRLWAADLALRCSSVVAVVIDGDHFDMAAMRRLQLAAESSGALALLARRPHTRGERSIAATRWLVCSRCSPSMSPRWGVELLRCKTAVMSTTKWVVELGHANSLELVSTDMVDRPGETAIHKTEGRKTA